MIVDIMHVQGIFTHDGRYNMRLFYQSGVKKFGIFHSGVYVKKLSKTG